MLFAHFLLSKHHPEGKMSDILTLRTLIKQMRTSEWIGTSEASPFNLKVLHSLSDMARSEGMVLTVALSREARATERQS